MIYSTACVDWEKRIVGKQSLIAFPPIFQNEADYALGIFKQLKVVDLPGSPTFGESADQWVFDYVSAIFGAYDRESNKQLIRESVLLISKKNTKSTIAAGIMLTALIINWRKDEEILILAPTVEVAQNSFKPAASMVRADPELNAMFKIQEHIRTITHQETRATLKVVAAETDAVSGKKAGRVLIDELWVFGKKPNADAMLMEATGGQISRPEGFIIYLTTQSDEAPAGVFKEKLDYARDVRDGKVSDNRFLPVLYEYPPEYIKKGLYKDPKYFYITNPNIGRSVDEDWLSRELSKQLHKQDGSAQVFLAKHLNVEIGLNLRSNRWAGADYWEQNKRDTPVTLQTLLDECEVIEVGVDGGGLDDLLGLSFAGRVTGGTKWLTWCYAWAHKDALERRKEIAPRLRDFANRGEVTIFEIPGQDVAELAEMILKVEKAGLLDKIGVDPVGLGGILEALEDAGIDKKKIVGISQGWKMTGAIKTAERKLASNELQHGGQDLMSWCVSNAKIIPTANAVMITKQASGSGKIDPLIALINAVTLLSLNPPSAKKAYQVYIF